MDDFKRGQLEGVAAHRDYLREHPRLTWLFFEVTNRCNLHCKHCGSSCTALGYQLSVSDIEKVLCSVQSAAPMVCLTGGEPLLHSEFFDIASAVKKRGLYWGMTTNATLIDRSVARDLHKAGMSTVSVSLDGLEKTHDNFRDQKGSWTKALNGIRALQEEGFEPQVTTVVHQDNINELNELYSILCELNITSWRVINIEPIGRACESYGLMLTPEQLKYLLSYIRAKRFDHGCHMEVTYGCSHYLGVRNERMVRDHYFLCGAGILVASVRCNGDICACLDIPDLRELVQGNIKTDDFMDVWNNRFQVFRNDRTKDCSKCLECSERYICGGDSTHTWDFKKKEPLLCVKDFDVII